MRKAMLTLTTFHRAYAMPKTIFAQKKQLQQPIHMMSLKQCHTASGKGTTMNFDDMGMAQFLKPIFDTTQDWIDPTVTFGQIFEALKHKKKKEEKENSGCVSAAFDRVFEGIPGLDEKSSELDEESSGLEEESPRSDEESSGIEKRKLKFGDTRWYMESEVDINMWGNPKTLHIHTTYNRKKKIESIERVLYVTENELQATKYHVNFMNFARIEKEKEIEEFRLKCALDENEYEDLILIEELELGKRLNDFLIKASKINFSDFSASNEVKNLMDWIKDFKPTEIILDLAPYGKSPDTDTLRKTYLLSSMIKERFPHLSFHN